MALTRDDVAHVAKLARLTLTEEELHTFTTQLECVFEHLDTLNEVDTEGVEETSQVNGLRHVTRSDKVEAGIPREDFLKVSQRDNERGMIKVRKSI